VVSARRKYRIFLKVLNLKIGNKKVLTVSMEYSIKLVKLIVEEVLKAKKIRQKVKY